MSLNLFLWISLVNSYFSYQSNESNDINQSQGPADDDSVSDDDGTQHLDVVSDEDNIFSDDDGDVVDSACDYRSSDLAQPLIVVAAALVILVIGKNMSSEALDSIVTVLMVSIDLIFMCFTLFSFMVDYFSY